MYVDRSTGHTEVFNFENNTYASGGAELQFNRDTSSSEFGGPLDLCDDAEFYCLETALHIAVPKQWDGESWTVSDIKCSSVRKDSMQDNLFNVTCVLTSGGGGVSFVYSAERGVLSYRRSCGGCSNEELQLLGGGKGIFARP